MAGSHGGGRNTGGRGRGRNTGGRGRGRTRSRDPNPPLLVDANVVADIGGVENFVNPADPNPPLLVHENVVAEIGGVENSVNPADPNVFPQQNLAALGGSDVAMAAAPVGEGSSQNQQPIKRARLNPVQNPPPPLRLQQASRAQPLPPLPHPPAVHYPVDNMGGTPDALQRIEQLHELCTKKLSNADMEKLVITGRNRPFLIQEFTRFGIAFPAHVFVQIVNGPARIVELQKKGNSDKLTLLWATLVASQGFRLGRGQLVDMWFEIDTDLDSASIYINGDRLQS